MVGEVTYAWEVCVVKTSSNRVSPSYLLPALLYSGVECYSIKRILVTAISPPTPQEVLPPLGSLLLPYTVQSDVGI